MNKFFEALSFKQKIIVGFFILSSILILGMGYMMFKFTQVASLGTVIIERNQPVTNIANKALKNTQSINNQLHKFVLTDGATGLDDYAETIKQLQDEIQTLLQYAKDPDLVINKQHLERSITIIEEIDDLSTEIVELEKNYEQNHPIITTASSVLNSPALEYLGLITQIIDSNATDGLPLNALLLLTEIRHSWAQVMSHLRVALATRSLDELVNVTAYVDVNNEQTERLKAMKLNLGFEGIEELELVRNKYLNGLKIVIDEFHNSIWRRDAHIMVTKIMPLYDELESYLSDIAKSQLIHSELAGTGLATELSNARYVFIALISIGLAFAFFISIFISRSLRRPLQQLVIATKAVAKGNLETKIDTSGNDEIAQLNDSFNDMVSDLRESQSALTNALQETKQASKTKSHFLSSMSHELRTPLNAILGFTQLLEMSINKNKAAGQPNDDYQNYAQQVLKAGRHLLDLINAVLDLSRIEEGHLNLQQEPQAVHETVLECISQIEAGLATKRHITLIDNIGEHEVLIVADRLRLRQVLINLMSNAVKYNQDYGSVTIESALTKENTLRLSVTDTGPGIAEQDIDKLFDPFERLSYSHGSIEGTGIGLTVTQQLMEAMGGSIGVNSTVGEGSTFWIELPVFNSNTDTASAQSKTGSSQLESQTEMKPHTNRKVLYIEDNPANAELVTAALNLNEEFECLTSLTAEEGLSMAKEQTPDIILLDINLPGMDGFAALKILRNHKLTRHIPVIAISANAMDTDLQAGHEAGFDDYITKPIDIHQLFSVLKRY
jgi:signal transduction histidine kinase/CHASE3 domain sensor protein